MVDHHGSQCGFCTPGIVMSLFALYHQRAAATYAERLRCARRQSLPLHRLSADHRRGAGDLRRRAGRPFRRRDRRARRGAGGARRRPRPLRRRRRRASSPRRRARLRSPSSTPAIPRAMLVGGATDVGLWITKQLRDLKQIIWLGRVAGLDAIEATSDALRIGAGATLRDAAPHLAALHPDLGVLMPRFGSRQVRESGTVGGNIANGSPIGDLAPALIALGARVELAQGRRQARPAARGFLPRLRQAGSRRRRIRQRRRRAAPCRRPGLSRLQGHEALRRGHFRRDGRLPLHARRTAHRERPRRLRRHGGDAEARRERGSARLPARGSTIRASWAAALEALQRDFTPLADMRASAAYRAEVAANLLKKALIEVAGGAAPTRIGERPCRAIDEPAVPVYEPREQTAVVHKPHPHDSARLHVQRRGGLCRRHPRAAGHAASRRRHGRQGARRSARPRPRRRARRARRRRGADRRRHSRQERHRARVRRRAVASPTRKSSSTARRCSPSPRRRATRRGAPRASPRSTSPNSSRR